MAYIGKQPVVGNFVKLDAIVTSATATYNLLNGGVAYFPQTANNCIVSLNGVIQSPTSAYTISGSTIVFDSALTALDTIDFILVLGDVLAIGTPSDGTVTAAKLASGTVGLISWQSVQTTGFTASAGRGYPLNTTSAAFTVTLPATPSVGDTIILLDYAGTFDTNALTISPNGNKIEGATANLQLTGDREGATLVYIDATQGWLASSGINEGTDALSPQPYSVDFLVVAGGGGGGGITGGGGGAGGFRTSTQSVGIGTAITVTVGDGGAGGASGIIGTSGSSSSISGSGLTTITSAGGGGGGSEAASPNHIGLNGGSGGGGDGATGMGANVGAGGTGNTPSTSPSQGNNGGTGGTDAATWRSGGGGGGAGAAGTNHTTGGTQGSAGGNGTASSITGSSVTYAGGGGGGGNGGSTSGTGGTGGGGNAGVAGTVNLGGGGGGGTGNPNVFTGGSGGKGVVILSVPTASYSGTTTGSPTVTTKNAGADTVLKFTGSGTYTG